MEFLNCYTIKDSIEEGLYVNDFESIIVEDPSTTSIKKATIEMVPVIPTDAETNDMAENSLVFLHEAGKKDKASSSHVIIAVDPAKWKLCYAIDNISILDPCGINGLMLLLVSNDTANVLVKADSRTTSLQFQDKKLVIAPCGRAAMLREAVVKRRLTATANTLKAQYQLTPATTA